jgi:hypothetical protein
VDEGEGPEVTTGGRGEVVIGVLEGGGRELDEVIVIVDIVDWFDGGGGSVGGGGRCGAVMGGLGEVVDIDLYDAEGDGRW